MWVKDKISEMYIQINEPYAKKETVSRLSTLLKNASTLAHISERAGSFKL